MKFRLQGSAWDEIHRQRFAPLIPAILVLLAACNLSGKPPCPVDDKAFCEFVQELEPLFVAVDADAIMDRAALECCKGDYAWPDQANLPGFAPNALRIRSGAFRGEGGCSTAEEFKAALAQHAPLSIEYLVSASQNFAELRIPMGEFAIMVGTRDPEWFLAVFAQQVSDAWALTAILQIRRTVLDLFPADSFISWPPDLQTPRLPPRVTEGVG
jgi:hypothetical protein